MLARRQLDPTPPSAGKTAIDDVVFERSVYGASESAKPKAFVITLLLHAAFVAVLVLKWSGAYGTRVSSTRLIVTMQPLASPPEPEAAAQEKIDPERRKELQPKAAVIPPPLPHIVVRAVGAPAIPLTDVRQPEPEPPPPETTAPKAVPAPPAAKPQNNGPDSWEGRVLARLEMFRRYPAAARGARQQGVAYIRFRMNRDGHVLSSSLVRSSGFPNLDEAALETLRRARPLPKIPDDRPDEIEITVPVEFYIR